MLEQKQRPFLSSTVILEWSVIVKIRIADMNVEVYIQQPAHRSQTRRRAYTNKLWSFQVWLHSRAVSF
jgi:hypothetical protein